MVESRRRSWLTLTGTFRTAKISEDDPLPHPDMTAAEIAQSMGYSDLFDALAPIVCHSLPPTVQDRLQSQLHWLLKDLVRDHSVLQLRLPELSVLTELENPVMWFPVYVDRTGAWVSPLYARRSATDRPDYSVLFRWQRAPANSRTSSREPSTGILFSHFRSTSETH